MLDAGTQTLMVTFTPTDTVRYTSTSKTVSITVNKATATISWNDPAPITYGTLLNGPQLNATSSAPGTITYSPTAGTALGAGNEQSLTATLPASTNYEAATKTVTIHVTPAPLTITADDKQRSAGVANPTLTASYAGFVNGDTAASLDTPVSLSTTATNHPGDYRITASGAADANYAITFVPGTLTIIGVDDFLPGDYAIQFGNAQVGVPVSGILETEGDRDRFDVTLQAGIQYDISLEGMDTGGGSLIDPAIYGVFNSQGQSVAGGADNNSGIGTNALVEQLVVDVDGIYQIEVGSAQDLDTGDYTLTVESVGYIDDFLPGISGAIGSVTIDGRATGEIELSGDVDGFRISLQANTTYAISIRGRDSNNGTLVDPDLLGIFSSSDLLGTPNSSVQTLKTQFFGDDSTSVFTPQNAGEYFIGVQDIFGGVGTYTVAVDNIGVRDNFSADVDTAGLIAPGGSAAGRIDFGQDNDWFESNLSANRVYEISLMHEAGGNALADPFFAGVYDRSGVLIGNTENDDGGDGNSSALQFVTDDAGTFYLAAGGFGNTTGQYRLELNDLGVLDDATFDITIEYASDDVPDSYIAAFEDGKSIGVVPQHSN